MKSYLSFLFFLVGFSSLSWAQDAAELDTVEITAQAPLLSPLDLAGNHQRIDRSEFQQKFTLLPDLLAQQSGIEIHSIGGIGQYASPSIRGSSGQQVLVFWDGMLINSLNGGGVNLSNINLSAADHIDIYRGLAPIELAASAIGGVVHLKSKELSENKTNNGQACATLGSYGLQQYCLSQQWNSTHNQLFINAEYLNADNDFRYLEQHPVSNPNKPQTEKRYNNGAQQQHIFIKNSHQFSLLRADISLQNGQAEQALSAQINHPQNQASLSSTQQNVQLRFFKEWNKDQQSEWLTQFQENTELYDDTDNRVGLDAQLNEYRIQGYRVQFNHYAKIQNLNLTATTRLHNEKTDTDFKLLSQAQKQAQCANGYACETRYEREQWDTGLRLQYWLNDSNLTAQFSHIVLADHNLDLRAQRRQNQLQTWFISAQKPFFSFATAYISLSDQVRLPNTHEIFGDRGTSIGNPKLQPEQARNYESGLELTFEKVQSKSSLYLRHLSDAIVAESDSRGVIHFDNLAKTQHLGFEHSLTWQPESYLKITQNLTLQNNEIIQHQLNPAFKGNQVAGFSPIHSYSSIKWLSQFWDFTFSHNFLYGGFYTNSNSIKKDKENRFDADLGFFQKNWRLSLSVSDIGNHSARTFPSYPEPGRMYFARLNYQW